MRTIFRFALLFASGFISFWLLKPYLTVNFIRTSETPKKLVVVLGAGVVGLNSALALLNAGYAVLVVAKHLPGDLDVNYCSPWAASTWAANPTIDDPEMRRWYTKAFQLWESLSDEGNDAGVSRRTYYSYLENFPDSSTLENGAAAFWYSDIVQDFKILSSEELIAGRNGVKWGYAFTSFAIDAPKYLKFLEGEIRSRGGVFIRSSLPIEVGLAAVLESVSNLVEKNLPGKEIFAFVHATGMGAKQLVGDEKIFPMKSQSVYIKGEANKIAGRLEVGSVSGDGYEGSADVPGIPIYYGSPRIGSGYTVLGGFMDEGNWSEEINPLVTEKLLEKNKILFPELLNQDGEFDFISEQLGMRPHRVGGIRLEIEYVSGAQESRKVPIVHNYGHSHGGFVKSVGSAGKVVQLINGLDTKKYEL